MFRHPFALRVNEGCMNSFRSQLSLSWPAAKEALNSCDAFNFSLWNCSDLVFGYFETDEKIEDYEPFRKVEKAFGDTFTWISEPYAPMRLMYQDYGVYRLSKELIRHRVFMTKLVPGSEEEYKRRHDGLVEARNGAVTPGPDSNFTIWNAGGYIFGYDEIDVTMETEETPEAHESTVQWETKMLEIMDWVTDDVDWLTGKRHPHVVRLAFYR